MAPDIICPARGHLNSSAFWEGRLREVRQKKTYKGAEAAEGSASARTASPERPQPSPLSAGSAPSAVRRLSALLFWPCPRRSGLRCGSLLAADGLDHHRLH